MARRRDKGEGSVYELAGGAGWRGYLDLGWEGGRRRRKYFSGATKREVLDKLNAARRALGDGQPVPTSERQTVADFLERWLAEVVKPNRRPTTAASYEQLVRGHISPDLGRIRLTKLTAQDVQGFINRKRAGGLSPRTVHYLRAVLRSALNQAVRWRLVAHNAAEPVEVPELERKEVRPLTPEEARAFLAAVKGDRLEALYTVALACGLRRGEALALRWEDVDLAEGTIDVRRSYVRAGNRAIMQDLTKTSSSRRTIALPERALAALKAHRRRQLEERVAKGEAWADSGLVFPSTVGTPIGPRNAVRDFKAMLARAGLRDQRLHDMRHACATLLLAQGVPMHVVSAILGHSRIGITVDTYGHVGRELHRDAARRLGDVFAADGE